MRSRLATMLVGLAGLLESRVLLRPGESSSGLYTAALFPALGCDGELALVFAFCQIWRNCGAFAPYFFNFSFPSLLRLQTRLRFSWHRGGLCRYEPPIFVRTLLARIGDGVKPLFSYLFFLLLLYLGIYRWWLVGLGMNRSIT